MVSAHSTQRLTRLRKAGVGRADATRTASGTLNNDVMDYSQAIPATAAGWLVLKIRSRIYDTSVSCITQRAAAVTSDDPTPSWRPYESAALKATKERARATFCHCRSGVPPCPLEGPSMMFVKGREA